jgi:hypothetical protein
MRVLPGLERLWHVAGLGQLAVVARLAQTRHSRAPSPLCLACPRNLTSIDSLCASVTRFGKPFTPQVRNRARKGRKTELHSREAHRLGTVQLLSDDESGRRGLAELLNS